MKNNRLFTIIFFSILAVVLLAFFSLINQDKRYAWYENYKTENDQPYGTLFIRKLLASYATEGFVYNTKKPVHKLLDSLTGKHESMYVFIGPGPYLDSTDRTAFKKYIADGNDAFIISTNIQDELLHSVYTPECINTLTYGGIDTITVNANFYLPAFTEKRPHSFAYRLNDEDIKYYWRHLSPSVLCDSVTALVPLGYFDADHVNFFKIPHGKGNVYVHTNPIMFTNYFMTRERSTEYASSVFSHSGYRTIIWDEYSKDPFYQPDKSPTYNPLYYIMQQPSLRYAWWVMLALTLLYVFFAAKRKQRFIPVLEPKSNTSLAFLKMVSSLHYHNQNHGDMARKKMRHFLHFVRTRYNLSTQKVDETFIQKLAAKSKVSEAEIEIILNQYRIIDNFQDIDSGRLADLYTAIDNFYKQAK